MHGFPAGRVIGEYSIYAIGCDRTMGLGEWAVLYVAWVVIPPAACIWVKPALLACDCFRECDHWNVAEKVGVGLGGVCVVTPTTIVAGAELSADPVGPIPFTITA